MEGLADPAHLKDVAAWRYRRVLLERPCGGFGYRKVLFERPCGGLGRYRRVLGERPGGGLCGRVLYERAGSGPGVLYD